MGCNKGCNSNPCACNVVPLPYYEDPCFQTNQCQGTTIINRYSPVLRISTGWAVPEEGEIVTLRVSALADMLVGATISNPTYGDYDVVSYDQEGQMIKVTKASYNTTEVGTPIPSCTKFLVTGSGIFAEDIAEIQAEIILLEAQIESLQVQIGVIETDITNIENNIIAIEGDITTLQNDLDALELEVAGIQLSITALQGDVITLQGEVVILQGEVLALQTAVTDLNQGWSAVTEVWTQASASTITVPTGAATRFQKGDRLKFINNAILKYFVVVAVADTLLTVIGDTSGVHASAISGIYVSRAESPFGYPTWFDFAPNYTGFSAAPNVPERFRVDGNSCTYHLPFGLGTSNSTSYSVGLPITALTVTNGRWDVVPGISADNGVAQTTPAGATILSGGTTVIIARSINGAGAAWTASGTKGAGLTIEYEF